jgi:P-type Ca2+ transporter type 2C
MLPTANLTRADSLGKPRRFKVTTRRNVLLGGGALAFAGAAIAFLEMVIDPVCSLVFEAKMEEDDVMRRPPRAPDGPLFSGSLIGWSLLQGAFAFGLVAIIFVLALRQGMPEEEVRALAFFSWC